MHLVDPRFSARDGWRRSCAGLALGLFCAAGAGGVAAAELEAGVDFQKNILPLLVKYCYDCHADGVNKGNVAFDHFKTSADITSRRDLWYAALKNVRAGVMPPIEEGIDRPSVPEIARLAQWIKYDALGLKAGEPDPGRVTVRRLNRVEYRNTIRDLMGIEFQSEVEFPPDDSGDGFDNIGEVLTISPLLLEKYLQAAEVIVERAVPKVSRVMPIQTALGKEFRATQGGVTGERLNVTKAAVVARTFRVPQAETYGVEAELEIRGSFDFDPGQGTVIARIDGEEWFRQEVAWQDRKTLVRTREVVWQAGAHVVEFEIVPRAQSGDEPPKIGRPQSVPGATSVTVRVASVQVKGPLNPSRWTVPEGYARFFPRGPAPADAAERDGYARELLGDFAARAHRRPVEKDYVERLMKIARANYFEKGHTFEEGIGRAMMAVLASPRFLFRIEKPTGGSDAIADVDEYSLASRLSYFLWSSMPDAELIRLAQDGELRRQLPTQIKRMMADEKSQSLVRSFIGQWLQVRDVESVPINARAVLGVTASRNPDGSRVEFNSELRRAMRSETEMTFSHVLAEDRSVLELLDGGFTFLNERLAKHYGVDGVTGDNLRLVRLPADSPRGGILTQGAVLTVTSNPTRTSPVKRGLFVLENILGTPPPPAPPDVPALEEAAKRFAGREPKLSEMLAVHRENKLCNSCHERMDPLGLAFENFTALGTWRETEAGQLIEVSGRLVTGERFSSVRELKGILTHERRLDYYRCLTEKLLTYSLGRGLTYHDTDTVDQIVGALEREGGRMSVLINGVIESVPFQKLRRADLRLTSSSPATSPLSPTSVSFAP
jgi:hypothetical protein